MIQLCSKSIACSLKHIFGASLLDGDFLECCKRANVVSVHKKECKNLAKNFWLISLPPFFEKVSEIEIFKNFFNDFHKNELFIPSIKMNYLLIVSSALYMVILLFYSYYLLVMISTLYLNVILHRMSGVARGAIW